MLRRHRGPDTQGVDVLILVVALDHGPPSYLLEVIHPERFILNPMAVGVDDRMLQTRMDLGRNRALSHSHIIFGLRCLVARLLQACRKRLLDRVQHRTFRWSALSACIFSID